MPKGFPNTVADGYRSFFYHTNANVFVLAFSMTVSTQALLGGFFAGSTASIWMLKDLAPTVLSAVAANYFVSLEDRVKFWFVVASLVTQGAIIAEFLIPTIIPPAHFLVAAATTSFLKGTGVLMTGVTRATILQHFATSQNMGDLTKKLQSVAMVAWTLCGALGLAFVSVFPSFSVRFGAVCCCCVASFVLTFRAVCSANLRILTKTALGVILDVYSQSKFSQVPTPKDVARVSGVLASNPPTLLSEITVNPLLTLLESITESSFAEASSLKIAHRQCCFSLGLWNVKQSSRFGVFPRPSRESVVLLIHKECDLTDLLTGLMLSRAILERKSECSLRKALQEELNEIEVWATRAMNLYNELRVAGWDTGTCAVEFIENRISIRSIL